MINIFLGFAIGVVFITILFLLIANRYKPSTDSPAWIKEQERLMRYRNELCEIENNLTAKVIIEARQANEIQRQFLNRLTTGMGATPVSPAPTQTPCPKCGEDMTGDNINGFGHVCK
jgi:hypothetical protein